MPETVHKNKKSGIIIAVCIILPNFAISFQKRERIEIGSVHPHR